VDIQNISYSSAEGVLFNKNRTVLILYPVGKQEKNYTIPASVISIWEGAFSDCTNLTSITIPSSVTTIGRAAFYRCTSLTSVTIPSSVISIGRAAFRSCTNLANIYVDVQNISYSSTEGVLFNKDGTVLIQYPAGKQEKNYTIPAYVTSVGNWAFSDCNSLTSVIIPTSVTSIEDFAFQNCRNLTSVIIYAGVTSVGNWAFDGCDNLRTVVLSRRTIIAQYTFPNTVQITYSD